jgi:hypothetical protein
MQSKSSFENKNYLKSEKANASIKKNRIKFIRFFYQDLPIAEIAKMRNNVPEIDILLKAFQL